MTESQSIYFKILNRILDTIKFFEAREHSYAKEINKIVNDQQNPNNIILDIGSGKGEIVQQFDHENANIITLDTLPVRIESSKINQIRGDAHHLPLRPESIDIVTMISLIEHLETPELCLKEVHTSLKPDGINILQLPNPRWFLESHTIWPFLGHFPKQIQKAIINKSGYRTQKNVGVEGVNRFYLRINSTLDNIQKLYNENGFNLKSIKRNYYDNTLIKKLYIPPSFFIIFNKQG